MDWGFNVYGPGQRADSPYSAVIPIFISRMIKKLSITINGGFQTRDFIYVNDVTDIMIKLMKKIKSKKGYHVFNLGTGSSIKIDLLFKLIKKNIGANPKLIRRKIKKFDPKKSAGTYKKILKFLKIKKYSFTKLEKGLNSSTEYIKQSIL